MNQPMLEKRPVFNCKATITALALTALICRILSSIDFFVGYSGSYDSDSGEWVNEMTFYSPDVFYFFDFLLYIAPCVLLVIYFLGFRQKNQATVLLPMAYALIAFEVLYNVVVNILENPDYYASYYEHIFRSLDIRGNVEIILEIQVIIIFILAAVSALKGYFNKGYSVVAVMAGLIYESWRFLQYLPNTFLGDGNLHWYLTEKVYLFVFTVPIGILGTIALYASLLLFGLTNRIPALIPVFPESASSVRAHMNPEQELRILKEKYDRGTISAAEYRIESSKIINRP